MFPRTPFKNINLWLSTRVSERFKPTQSRWPLYIVNFTIYAGRLKSSRRRKYIFVHSIASHENELQWDCRVHTHKFSKLLNTHSDDWFTSILSTANLEDYKIIKLKGLVLKRRSWGTFGVVCEGNHLSLIQLNRLKSLNDAPTMFLQEN